MSVSKRGLNGIENLRIRQMPYVETFFAMSMSRLDPVSTVAQPEAGIAGGMIGVGIKYLSDVVSKNGEGWKPVVFGNWMSTYIKQIINQGAKHEEIPD